MKTPKQIREQFIDVEVSPASIERAIKAAQKETWIEAVETCAKHAKMAEIKVQYTGVRAGGFYYEKVVDIKALLRIKKLFK